MVVSDHWQSRWREYYANRKVMISGLDAALLEFGAAEKLQAIVTDKNREKGLPLNEARQAFKYYHAKYISRTNPGCQKMKKSSLTPERLIFFQAGKLYAQQQTKASTVELKQSRSKSL